MSNPLLNIKYLDLYKNKREAVEDLFGLVLKKIYEPCSKKEYEDIVNAICHVTSNSFKSCREGNTELLYYGVSISNHQLMHECKDAFNRLFLQANRFVSNPDDNYELFTRMREKLTKAFDIISPEAVCKFIRTSEGVEKFYTSSLYNIDLKVNLFTSDPVFYEGKYGPRFMNQGFSALVAHVFGDDLTQFSPRTQQGVEQCLTLAGHLSRIKEAGAWLPAYQLDLLLTAQLLAAMRVASDSTDCPDKKLALSKGIQDLVAMTGRLPGGKPSMSENRLRPKESITDWKYWMPQAYWSKLCDELIRACKNMEEGLDKGADASLSKFKADLLIDASMALVSMENNKQEKVIKAKCETLLKEMIKLNESFLNQSKCLSGLPAKARVKIISNMDNDLIKQDLLKHNKHARADVLSEALGL